MRDDYDFSKGKRGSVIPTPAGKTRITIRLDEDILNWFRNQVEEAGGGSYQAMINNALRDYIERSTEPLEELLRTVVREEVREAIAEYKANSLARTKTMRYDVAEQLRTPEEMAAYLDAWLAEAPDDVAGIARALGDIARAKGMSKVASAAGLSRESLAKALSEDGNPSLATVLKVAKVLGLRLHAAAM